jgi:hypothetical protein
MTPAGGKIVTFNVAFAPEASVTVTAAVPSAIPVTITEAVAASNRASADGLETETESAPLAPVTPIATICRGATVTAARLNCSAPGDGAAVATGLGETVGVAAGKGGALCAKAVELPNGNANANKSEKRKAARSIIAVPLRRLT